MDTDTSTDADLYVYTHAHTHTHKYRCSIGTDMAYNLFNLHKNPVLDCSVCFVFRWKLEVQRR